ncbi:MAG TPA: hypothetical protein VFJ20_11040 [Gemmatimonadaceae bacterium]|nr:hypothetical protein [Gemmatimonadaceae bacterium]
MADLPYLVDRTQIAERLRALLTPVIRRSRIRAVADELHVKARTLRESIDEIAPNPSVDVLFAVVRFYGVDPTWLLTGEYDSSSHREALEHPASAARLLARTSLPRDRSTRPVLDDLLLRVDVDEAMRADGD